MPELHLSRDDLSTLVSLCDERIIEAKAHYIDALGADHTNVMRELEANLAGYTRLREQLLSLIQESAPREQ